MTVVGVTSANKFTLGFAFVLFALQSAIVAAFGYLLPPEPKPAAPVIASAWRDITPSDLADHLGVLFRDLRLNVDKNRYVQLDRPTRIGDDLVIRVALGAGELGYPNNEYRLDEHRECRFSSESYDAMTTIAMAFQRKNLEFLADRLPPSNGQHRVSLTFLGTASTGKVIPRRNFERCQDGKLSKYTTRNEQLQTYDSQCGAHECTVEDETGRTRALQVHSSDIDSNEMLTCLRALCLKHEGSLATFRHPAMPIFYRGRIGTGRGLEQRRSEILFRVHGVASDDNRDFFEPFITALGSQLVQRPNQPSP